MKYITKEEANDLHILVDNLNMSNAACSAIMGITKQGLARRRKGLASHWTRHITPDEAQRLMTVARLRVKIAEGMLLRLAKQPLLPGVGEQT